MSTEPDPEPLTAEQCGALGLCELPKGHVEKMHTTSVDRAAELDGTHGYLVFEGPDGQLMRTPYRAATPSSVTPDLRAALDALEQEVRRQLRNGAPGIDPMASINRRDLDARFAAVRALASVTPSEPTPPHEHVWDHAEAYVYLCSCGARKDAITGRITDD